ncbi:hypothetical protein B9Z55_007879 [Caenorhabditis nigoni]|uniref:Endonuclease/exonuclease/phosphatase domain-containing protein n=1 Tax=Caenorhabditis nigoni TaxID=1611254 RepID=A0A2G5VCB3_9PELO|nr:hypothetical protein B9Z55_007879 [Caenorhabditis nigoni]
MFFLIEAFCLGTTVPHALRIGSWNLGYPGKDGLLETEKPETQGELETPQAQPQPTTPKRPAAKTTPKKLTPRQQKLQEDLQKKKKAYIDYCKKSKCDVIALQETNYCVLPEDVKNNGYTLKSFPNCKDWSASPGVGKSGKSYDRGLAFLICNPEISISCAEQPHPRMAYIEFQLKDVDVMVMNIYGVTCDPNNRYKPDASVFFLYITKFIAEKRFSGIVILCGDLNAFPDQASLGLFEPYVGKHVYGSSNSHGDIFVDFLVTAKLFHLNSRFEKPGEQKWTFKGRGKQTKTELDGFLCSKTDLQFVQDVDTFIDDYRPSDHRLIASLWSISKKYESREKHSDTNWAGYETALSDLVSLASIGTYNEFAQRITSAAPSENMLMGFVNNLDSFTKDQVEAYLKEGEEDDEDEEDEEEEEEEEEDEEEAQDEEEEEEQVKESELSVEENEVNLEFERMNKSQLPGKDMITSNMIKNGGTEMVKAATKLFREILKSVGCPVPEDWKKVFLEAPQTVFPQKNIKNVVFDERVCPLVQAYSSLLVRKCYKQFCSYVDKNEQLASSKSSFETIRKERDLENLFTMSLLLERYSSNKPVYLLFAKFKKPMKNVTTSSVLEGLNRLPIHSKLKTAFESLLTDVKIELLLKNELIDFDKKNGIHLGDVASAMLLESVVRMLLDECDNIGSVQNIGLQVGDEKLRRIIWDDMVIFVGEDVQDLQTQAGRIHSKEKTYNLILDKDSMVFMTNKTPGRELRVNGNEVKLTKFPNVSHRNWILVATEKTSSARKKVKCRNGTKAEIQKRTRQIQKNISEEMTSWNERYAETLSNAETFFKESVIPTFFENCGLWNLAEFSSIKDSCSEFLKTLNIPNFKFNPKWRVLTEQARFLVSIKGNKLLLEMLKENQNLKITNLSVLGPSAFPLNYYPYQQFDIFCVVFLQCSFFYSPQHS